MLNIWIVVFIMGCLFLLMMEFVRELGDGFRDNVVVFVIFDFKIIFLELVLKFIVLVVRIIDFGGRFWMVKKLFLLVVVIVIIFLLLEVVVIIVFCIFLFVIVLIIWLVMLVGFDCNKRVVNVVLLVLILILIVLLMKLVVEVMII